jgi:hypothetical protein
MCELPTFTIPVDTLPDVLYIERAVSQLGAQRFYLKKTIYKEEKFKEIYKECLLGDIEIKNPPYVVNSFTIELNPQQYESHYNIFKSFFPISYSILHIKGEQCIIIPYLWNYFLCCNPKRPYVLIGESRTILEHLYDVYPNASCDIFHYLS